MLRKDLGPTTEQRYSLSRCTVQCPESNAGRQPGGNKHWALIWETALSLVSVMAASVGDGFVLPPSLDEHPEEFRCDAAADPNMSQSVYQTPMRKCS